MGHVSELSDAQGVALLGALVEVLNELKVVMEDAESVLVLLTSVGLLELPLVAVESVNNVGGDLNGLVIAPLALGSRSGDEGAVGVHADTFTLDGLAGGASGAVTGGGARADKDA